MRISYSNEISKPPDVVFDWIADPAKAMKWQKNVKGGEILVDRPEVTGTTFTELIEEDGKTLEMQGEITEYIKDEVIGFHLQSRVHEFDVRYAVEGTSRGTRLTIEALIEWKFPMNFVSFFAGKKIEKGIRDELHAEVLELKRLCESA